MKSPIKNFSFDAYPKGSISQYFGENPELYSRVVCKDDNGTKLCLAGHNGVDIVAPHGTPIFAVEGGLVANHKDSPTGYGKHVKIVNLSSGREWTYGHLSRIDVDLNQEVKEGDQIGLMGNTGFVISGATPYWEYNPYAGTHLHLGVREIAEYKPGDVNTTYHNGDRAHVKNWRGGFFGAVDPLPFLPQHEEYKEEKQLTIISLLNQIKKLYEQLIARQNT